MKIFLQIILLFTLCIPLKAEVFLLRDLFKRSKSNSPSAPVSFMEAQLRELLRIDVLYNEEIIINGESGSLEVGLADFTYPEFLNFLDRMKFKNISANNQNCVLILDNMRYFIYNSGEFSKAVCFVFNVKYRKNPPGLPHYIPDPGGNSVHSKIVMFPSRRTTYVTFDSIFNAEDAFRNCENQLRAQGILRIGGRSDSPTAGFFMNGNGSKIVLASFNEEYKNGFIYHFERKK